MQIIEVLISKILSEVYSTFFIYCLNLAERRHTPIYHANVPCVFHSVVNTHHSQCLVSSSTRSLSDHLLQIYVSSFYLLAIVFRMTDRCNFQIFCERRQHNRVPIYT